MATDNKATAAPTQTATPTATVAPAQTTTATVAPAQTTTAAAAPAQTATPTATAAPAQTNADTLSLSETSKDSKQDTLAPSQETVQETVQQPTATAETNNPITSESLKGLNVGQLNDLLVRGVHTPDESKALADAIKNTEKEGNIKSTNGEQPQAKEDDDKGPFKEGDIIKYMYEDWLIGGANWLWKKSAEKIDKGYFRMKRALNKEREKNIVKDEKNSKKVETRKAHNKIEDNYTTKMDSKAAFFGEHNDKIQENIKVAQKGKIEETTFDEKTKKLLSALPENKRKDFCKFLSKSTENLHNNLANVEKSSAMITKAQMTAELCQDPKAFEGKEYSELFDAYQKKNKVLLAKRLDKEIAEGRDPTKFMNETLKLAKNASEQADKNIDKGKFAEHDEKPGKNEYLDKINKSLGVSTTDSATQDNQPKGIFEQFNADNNIENAIKKQQDTLNSSLGETANRRASNEVRQDKLIDMYGKIAARDPAKADEMNKRIANLRGTGPVSGVSKTDKIAEQKISENSTQRKMADMLGANR